jgi:transposase
MILRPDDPQQMEFLCRADLVRDEPLVRAIDEVVRRLDLSELYHRYSEAGRSFYDPAMQLKVLFFGYCDGVRKSRDLARHVRYDVRYRYFTGTLQPDFRTLNRFRKRNLDLLPGYFAQLVGLCEEVGLVDVSVVALDGTKIRASASGCPRKKKSSRDQLTRRLQDELTHDVAVDDEDTGSEGAPDETPSLPAGTDRDDGAKRTGNRVRSAPQCSSAADPDARFMKTSEGGLRLSYNAQVVADANQVIIAAEVSDNADDSVMFRPMVEQSQRMVQRPIEKITADGGYYSGRNLKYAAAAGLDVYSPIAASGRAPDDRFNREAFVYDADSDRYRCPAGKWLTYHGSRKRNGVVSRTYRGSVTGCGSCSCRSRCTPGKYRSLQISEVAVLERRMNAKLATAGGRKTYDQRKHLVEPIFGNMKFNFGFTRFGLRTLPKVRGEFLLVCIAHNLRKLAGWWNRNMPRIAAESLTTSVFVLIALKWLENRCIIRPIRPSSGVFATIQG